MSEESAPRCPKSETLPRRPHTRVGVIGSNNARSRFLFTMLHVATCREMSLHLHEKTEVPKIEDVISSQEPRMNRAQRRAQKHKANRR